MTSGSMPVSGYAHSGVAAAISALKASNPNPNFSTSGLNALIGEYYAATGTTSDLTAGAIADPDVVRFVKGVESSVVHYGDISITFLENLRRADEAAPADVPYRAQLRLLTARRGFLLVSCLAFVNAVARTGALFNIVPILARDRLALHPDRIGFGLALASVVGLVVAYDIFANDTIRRAADIVLPGTVWLEDLGIKHVVVQAFDDADQSPRGRLNSLERILAQGADGFETVIVDTSVMNLPATSFSLAANRMIKEKLGLPCGGAYSNGTHMWKDAKTLWSLDGFRAMDAVVQGMSSVLWSDFNFYGPIVTAPRIFPAVAAAHILLTTLLYDGTKKIADNPDLPIKKYFGDFLGKLTAGAARK